MSTGWQGGDKTSKIPGKTAAAGRKTAARRGPAFTAVDAALLAVPVALFGLLYFKVGGLENRLDRETAKPSVQPAVVAGYEARIASLEQEIRDLRSGYARLSATTDAHEGILSDLNMALLESSRRGPDSAAAAPQTAQTPQPQPREGRLTVVQAPTPILPRPDGTVDFSEFVDGYFDNTPAYDTQYKGKTVSLRVKVQSVDKASGSINPGGKATEARTAGAVLLRTDFSGKYKTMECYFPASRAESVLKLKAGDAALVKGKVLGKGLSVYLADCEIVSP